MNYLKFERTIRSAPKKGKKKTPLEFIQFDSDTQRWPSLVKGRSQIGPFSLS